MGISHRVPQGITLMRTQRRPAALLTIAASTFCLTITPPAVADEPTLPDFGIGSKESQLFTESSAHGSIIDVKIEGRVKFSGRGIPGTSNASDASGASGGDSPGGAWNPDTDPAFQKALRDRLMSDDDSIFFNARMMDTAKNKTVYGLQDPCTGDKGAALRSCRAQQECTDDSGQTGVSMDIVVGGASDGARSPRGTQMCVSDAQAGGAGDDGYVPLPTFTLQDFQRLAVAPAENHVQPAPDTLKNMNTNVYAVAQPQTFETTLGGYPVSVRAYPAQYTWNYGDGASLGPTPLTGAPLPEGAWDTPTDTSHVYTSTGDYSVTLTTWFYGEYNIAGTGWQPVAGYNQVTSAPVQLSVWRATVHNVADDCRVNPAGVGCPGASR